MNKKKLAVVVIIVLIIIAGVCYARGKASRNDGRVKASGTIEVQEVILAPLAGGRLIELPIKESQKIKKGDLIAKLSLDGVDDQLRSAEASLRGAKYRLEGTLEGFRVEEIEAAKANAAAAKIQYEQALRDENRFKNLAEQGAIAVRQAELASEDSRAKAEAYKAAAAKYNLYKRGYRDDEIGAAWANYGRAKAEVERAKVALSYKEFYSPADGVILTKNFEQGDVVSAGTPIATLGNMEDCWVKLYIPSTQLGLVKLGQEAEVKVDAYPDRIFKAKVTRVNDEAEYNPRLSLTQSERANMVFWIKISVENGDGVLKPGMPADVTLL